MRVTLNGYVVPTEDQWIYDWFGVPAFSPGIVRQALADNPEGEDLELEINSGGGSVFAGFEMYSLLREAGCRTVAIVQSLAGSAATSSKSTACPASKPGTCSSQSVRFFVDQTCCTGLSPGQPTSSLVAYRYRVSGSFFHTWGSPSGAA